MKLLNLFFISYETVLIVFGIIVLSNLLGFGGYLRPFEFFRDRHGVRASGRRRPHHHHEQIPHETELESAINPPDFLSTPLTGYIEPTIWEKPVLMNAHLPRPQFTRNF